MESRSAVSRATQSRAAAGSASRHASSGSPSRSAAPTASARQGRRAPEKQQQPEDRDAGLLHAVTDALIGAAALGDIGRHFPDTDERWQGADSRVLLRATVGLLAQAGWRVVNVDSTIVAQQPKMAPYIPQMVENIAADLMIASGEVNVKAKTSERLGFTGRGEGIAAEAVVLITNVD